MPYKTHLDLLRRAFELAADRGVQGIKVPGGRAVMAAELRPSSERWSEQEFTQHANRHRLQVRIQHIRLGISNGMTDDRDAFPSPGDARPGRIGCILRRAIQVKHTPDR